MKGYLIHGQGFVPLEGWYDTGDVVHIDEEGFISIQARLKRFAKVAGEMVSLNMVEALVADMVGDDRIAAVAVSDSRKGEKIVLFSEIDVSISDFAKYLDDHRYPNLLIPVKVIVVDEIPVMGSGKRDYIKMTNKAKEEGN